MIVDYKRELFMPRSMYEDRVRQGGNGGVGVQPQMPANGGGSGGQRRQYGGGGGTQPSGETPAPTYRAAFWMAPHDCLIFLIFLNYFFIFNFSIMWHVLLLCKIMTVVPQA